MLQCCHRQALRVQRLSLRFLVLLVASLEKSFRQRFCRAANCRALFFICTHCDRGQRYCSSACRLQTRLAQQRAARRRHQQSPEGRLDHRDRQRAYRRRQAPALAHPSASAAKSVTDHGSNTALSFATIAPLRVTASARPRQRHFLAAGGRVVCHFCGRTGRLLNPFHEPG